MAIAEAKAHEEKISAHARIRTIRLPAPLPRNNSIPSHYFETALGLSFCVRASDDSKQSGFYLIMAMGSEQAGLTGVKRSIVRKTAVGRSVSNLQNALTGIKDTLEAR
jgi:hypothetical protein